LNEGIFIDKFREAVMMIRKIGWMVILMAVFVSQSLLAQMDTLWTRTYGSTESDITYCFQQTTDNGFIIVGRTTSYGAGFYDVWLVRTDASGDTLWTQTFGGTEYDAGNYVEQTSDGGFVITGCVQSIGAGSNDVWIIKTDASGDTLWTRLYGGSSSDDGRVIQQLSDKGYMILAGTSSYGPGWHDFWLIRLDASGDTLWTKTYGGSDTDTPNSMEMTTDNGFILAGLTGSFGTGDYDGWLVKTDAAGDTLWTKAYGGAEDERLWDVQQTADGGYIITGYTNSYGAGLDDLWLVKIDGSGDTLWTRTIGGSEIDQGRSIQQTTDGGYIITGYTQSFGAGSDDVWLIKTDASGDTLWTKTFGGSEIDRGNCIRQTSDGGYIIVGYTHSYGHGESDVWLIRLAPDEPTPVVENKIPVPDSYRLLQNYPNPFNPVTEIRYGLPANQHVLLAVYNVKGEKVSTLVNTYHEEGGYSVRWEGRDDSGMGLPSGIYMCKMKTESHQQVIRMLYLK
jgi:hypothetical protein